MRWFLRRSVAAAICHSMERSLETSEKLDDERPQWKQFALQMTEIWVPLLSAPAVSHCNRKAITDAIQILWGNPR